MGNSKSKRNSYDIAPVVSNKDFVYKKNARSLPKVEQAAASNFVEENGKQIENIKQEVKAGSLVLESTANVLADADVNSEVQDPRIPDWVNKENFRKLLLKTHPTIEDIIAFKASPAMAAGENYTTFMLRIKISAQFEDNSIEDFSYMLKVAHNTKQMKDMLQAMNFFVTENTVYTEVMPQMEDMYRQAGVDIKFGAKSHNLDLDDNNIHYVLLDDLSVDGFKNANRLECLNMEHTLSVLRKMAQFHAASACRVAKNGLYPSVFSPNMDNEMARAMMNQMFMSFKKPFLDNLKTYDYGEKYYDVMEHFFDNLIELFIRNRKILPEYLTVLNHGDLWSNNILFKYTDDGKLEETLLVDFQNTNWSSPALDLYYFIISSVQIDIKLSQFDYFIRYYHEQLSRHLKLLEYTLEIPNLKDFHIQMIDFGSMATVTPILTLGVVLLDPTNCAKFENFMGDSEEGSNFKNAIYTNERYRKHINEILPWLYNRGFMKINLTDLDERFAVADKLEEAVSQQTTKQTENIEQLPISYPEWVNEGPFLAVVRGDCENYHKVHKFSVSPVTSDVRDNFFSRKFQVDIDVELTDSTTKPVSFMLKIGQNSKIFDDFMELHDVFATEAGMYRNFVPELEQLYAEVGLKVKFGAKSYDLPVEENYILLENLKVQGFKNTNRLDGLDREHTESVLKKLAQWHAASAVRVARRGLYPRDYCTSFIKAEGYELIKRHFDAATKTLLECVQQYTNSNLYYDKVVKLQNQLTDEILKYAEPDLSEFNVLNHGDCWSNNIMFKYDSEGNILETYLVDYQLPRYASPAQDLLYFLLSSTKLEIKLKEFEYFVKFYHDHLVNNLKIFNYDKTIPSLKEIHGMIYKYGIFGYMTTTNVMAVVLCDPTENATLDNFVNDSEDGVNFKRQMFSNARYREHMEAIFPWLLYKGILDC